MDANLTLVQHSSVSSMTPGTLPEGGTYIFRIVKGEATANFYLGRFPVPLGLSHFVGRGPSRRGNSAVGEMKCMLSPKQKRGSYGQFLFWPFPALRGPSNFLG